jgi:hypothetical protein
VKLHAGAIIMADDDIKRILIEDHRRTTESGYA